MNEVTTYSVLVTIIGVFIDIISFNLSQAL